MAERMLVPTRATWVLPASVTTARHPQRLARGRRAVVGERVEDDVDAAVAGQVLAVNRAPCRRARAGRPQCRVAEDVLDVPRRVG